jgi:hypothetical protein
MSRWTLAATAAAALFPACAGAGIALPISQYAVTTVVTELNDPGGNCPFEVVGQVRTGVATLKGLGVAWALTLFAPTESPPYDLNTINCTFSLLPTGPTFAGSPPTAPYNAKATCQSSAPGTHAVDFAFSNNPAGTPPTSSTVTYVPVSGRDDELRFDSHNVAVTYQGYYLCSVGFQTVLLRI